MRLSTSALFGGDFYQDAEVIKISKSSLNLAPGNHKAETILAAIILKALQPFEGVITGNGQVVTSGRNIPITYHNAALYDRLILFVWQRIPVINRSGFPVVRRSYVMEIYVPTIDYENTQPITAGDLEND
jgi:hypothetical protein